jgi:lipopolysaccharide transport system ATP-binding protein
LRFATWLNLPIKPFEENWVMRGVSFSVAPGEAIGIVGQNGAGKSTLLKMITGTLHPTEGQITVNGRIAAILELGMGFNFEYTGRQNAYHAAGLMGFNSTEIHALMPLIEEFAEIGEYFDQPVRTYSSGMQVRLAFAVATARRPEILIVDEALSVGDTYFQHKSFNRIREFREQGTTLLIVSHDRNAIQSLCERAILLEKGNIIKDGNPEEVMDFYNAIISVQNNASVVVTQHESGKMQTVSGTGEVGLKEISIHNAAGNCIEFANVGEPLEMRVKVKVNQPIESLVMGYSIKDRLGQIMYGTNTWHTKQIVHNPVVGNEYVFFVEFPSNLGIGSYSVSIALHANENHLAANYEWRDLALLFHVVNLDRKQFIGCNWLEPRIKIETV